ncbi:hypothetical protein BH24ACI5_BH24ACI5_04190 [soil metagenome]
MPRQKEPRTKPATKRALTPAQRLAIDRRGQERELRHALARIEETIRDEHKIPAQYRAKVANALCVLVDSGHLFALACLKAYLTRTWRKWDNPAEAWAFINAENALFERTMIDTWNDPGMVARWNAPDYKVPEERKAS